MKAGKRIPTGAVVGTSFADCTARASSRCSPTFDSVQRLLHALVWTRRHLAGQLAVPELPLLLPLLRANDVFLDVGARAGGWAVPVSRALTARHVYALSTAALRRRPQVHAGAPRAPDVTVIIGAVSDAEGELSIVWKGSAGRRLTGRTRVSRGSEAGEVVRVKALTIDRFCASHAISAWRW